MFSAAQSFRLKMLIGLCATFMITTSPKQLAAQIPSAEISTTQIPSEAKPAPQLSSPAAAAFVLENTIWLRATEKGLQQGKIEIPRLCAPIRSIAWSATNGSKIEINPEPSTWIISFKTAPAGNAEIMMELDAPPTIPSQVTATMPTADGSVLLHAYQATTHGSKLRFEPQWYKNTVGYWTVPADYASWQFVIEQPGRYVVAILQGCGSGQGGSDAKLSVFKDDTISSEIEFKTKETGHFQNFRWNEIGELTINETGEYELQVKPERIANAALFDIRMIHLIRQAN